MKKAFAATGLAVFVAASIALAQSDSTKSTSTEEVQDSQGASLGHQSQGGVIVEQALLNKLIKANEAEIELAKLAEAHSTNQDVKKLALHLITDHQDMNQNLAIVQQNVMHTNSPLKPSAQASVVPKEFCRLVRKSCENNLKMTKEMLTTCKSQNFDTAYLAHQRVAHTMKLAELKAIESDGPQDLRKTATDACTTVEAHLDMINELAAQLENDRKTPKLQ